MGSLVPFKRIGQQEPYPDLWPRATYDSVLHALHRNQPLEKVQVGTYHFAIKTDLPATTYSIIVQANNNVLYMAPKNKKSDADQFLRWFTKNNVGLKRLSDSGFSGTLVGKIHTADNVDYFCVYYVIVKNDVYLDEPSIDRLLRKKDDLFNGTLVAMPTSRVASIDIDKKVGEVTARDLQSGIGFAGPIVGFPVVHLEPRTTESGSEHLSPRLISTPIHMKYSGFLHTISPVSRRIRIDEST